MTKASTHDDAVRELAEKSGRQMAMIDHLDQLLLDAVDLIRARVKPQALGVDPTWSRLCRAAADIKRKREESGQ